MRRKTNLKKESINFYSLRVVRPFTNPLHGKGSGDKRASLLCQQKLERGRAHLPLSSAKQKWIF